MYRNMICLAVLLVNTLVLSACGGGGNEQPPVLVISDAAHGGRAGFYFLPPLVSAPTLPTPFGAGFTLTAEFETPGAQVLATTALAVDKGGRNYHGEIDLSGLGLDPAIIYRVRVLDGTDLLGFFDVQVAGTDSVKIGDAVVTLTNRILPIKVWVQGNTADATVPSITFNNIPGACSDINGISLVDGLDGLRFTVTDENLLDVTCVLTDQTAGTSYTQYTCSSPFQAGNLIDNHEYIMTIQAFDGTNTATGTRAFRSDAGGPLVDFTSPASGGTITLTGLGPFTGTLTIWDIAYSYPFTPKISFDGTQVTVTAMPPSGAPGSPKHYQYVIPSSVTAGTHQVKVESTDCIGYTSSPTAQFTVVRN